VFLLLLLLLLLVVVVVVVTLGLLSGAPPVLLPLLLALTVLLSMACVGKSVTRTADMTFVSCLHTSSAQAAHGAQAYR
jgi:hypothetical protein